MSGLLNKEIESNSKVGMNAKIATKKHEELVIKYTKAKEKLERAIKIKTKKCVKVRKLKRFMEKLDGEIKWNEEFKALMMEKAVLDNDDTIEFLDGRKVKKE